MGGWASNMEKEFDLAFEALARSRQILPPIPSTSTLRKNLSNNQSPLPPHNGLKKSVSIFCRLVTGSILV